METLVQVVTVALAVVAIIWHQQRTIDKLRESTNRAIEKLGEGVAANGQRLARIEGFLGIGIPQAAASKAAGATRPKQNPGEAEESGPT
ncbi:MAG: hypothetical protein OXC00_15940 [Acidimicrobiaceae bacterium]|nr:hypothetical protein [Acidimicrobiaceae bacterium]